MMNNKNYWKKKNIIVIFINLMVLFLVLYIYYVVDELRTLLLKEKLCVLKSSPMNSLTDHNLDEIYLDKLKATNQLKSRYTRSIDSIQFQHSSWFSLAQPNSDFEQNGILGPWILSNKSLSVDNHAIKLTSRRTLLEIVDEGLYLIYIQVYYLSSSKRNSFVVTKITANVNETLSVCSAMGVYGTEISCFTSFMEQFKTGESILVRLREISLNINLSRKGSHTYLGLIKLM